MWVKIWGYNFEFLKLSFLKKNWVNLSMFHCSFLKRGSIFHFSFLKSELVVWRAGSLFLWLAGFLAGFRWMVDWPLANNICWFQVVLVNPYA